MVKNIIIGILLFFMATLMIFAFIKANDAEKVLVLAEEQKVLAEENANMAEIQQQLAIQRAAEAQREKERADFLQEELQKCQGK